MKTKIMFPIDKLVLIESKNKNKRFITIRKKTIIQNNKTTPFKNKKKR
ncbi:hypothetical protein [Borreliella bavariensis]|nr:hypothetical protein [Borreliella bavariensis]